MSQFEQVIFLITIVFVGACLGSFINVVVYRLPKMMERQWLDDCINFLREYLHDINSDNTINSQYTSKNKDSHEDIIEKNPNINPHFSALHYPNENHRDLSLLINKIEDGLLINNGEKNKFNLITPASHCPLCRKTIPFYRNIPLFTWLSQAGRTYCCAQKISPRYFIIELLAAILTLWSISHFGINLQGFLAAGFLLSLLTLAAIDLETRLLPDTITIPLVWVGLLINLFNLFTSIDSAIYGAVVGYLILWLLYQSHKLLTNREGMGFGDFKLTAAFGAWLGIKAVPLILFIAAVIGIITAITTMRVRKSPRAEAISFGPALCIAAVIVLFYKDYLLTIAGY